MEDWADIGTIAIFWQDSDFQVRLSHALHSLYFIRFYKVGVGTVLLDMCTVIYHHHCQLHNYFIVKYCITGKRTNQSQKYLFMFYNYPTPSMIIRLKFKPDQPKGRATRKLRSVHFFGFLNESKTRQTSFDIQPAVVKISAICVIKCNCRVIIQFNARIVFHIKNWNSRRSCPY